MEEVKPILNNPKTHFSSEVINISNNKIYIMTKRTIDVVASLAGILILSWLFVFIAIAIKIEDPNGPIIFKQKRVGKNGEEFYMYKFRSMISNAEELLEELLKYNEVSGAMFKMKKDPRITKVGSFIRKTSIDELPQLWNVLKGNMTLVGPRPPLVREVQQYTPYDSQRLLVVPGCTGLWQVSGRSNIGFKEMVDLDLTYIQERNLFLDIRIIIKTFIQLLFSRGAY